MSLPMDLLLAFFLFAFVTSVTPSPNNTMLLASGVNLGFVRFIPHILGISCGFFTMVTAVGFGLGVVLKAYPMLCTILRYIDAAYLLYLAWKVVISSPAGGDPEGRGRPSSYWGAAAFQWVGPKAWMTAVGVVNTYAPLQGYFTNVMVISTAFALINAPTIGIWAGFDSMLRSVLRDPRWLRVLNVGMALLPVTSLYPILAGNHSAWPVTTLSIVLARNPSPFHKKFFTRCPASEGEGRCGSGMAYRHAASRQAGR